MPCHRAWLARVVLSSLILSALDSNHGTYASSIYRYPGERDVIDEDLDSLIEEFRRIGQNHQHEIAKEKLAPYGGGRGVRGGQGYPYEMPNYQNEPPRGFYQAVRGQKTKMPAWDRGEGLSEDPQQAVQQAPPPRHGLFGKHRHHQEKERQNIPQELENVPQEFQEQPKELANLPGRGSDRVPERVPDRVPGRVPARVPERIPERVQVPVPEEEEEERVQKESDLKPDVKIIPVPEEIQDQDQPPHPTPAARQDFENKGLHPIQEVASMADIYFLAVVAGCSVAGLVGLVVAGVCWYRLQKNVKATSEVEYPAYGITGPTKGELGSPGDRKLAQSAQMYHYQHQKQQMIALEKANGEMKNDGSEDDSDEENEEGDYTVYECPGLAPTGEMEVKNPLFSEETPVTPTPDDRREMK